VKTPLLSVCLITYNHASFVKEALDSILEQETNFPWQLIIADDYSTDGTREILREYKNRYPEKIHLILQKKNVGPETNWLDLMQYPRTTYVAYVEGDDYYTDKTKLQRQIDFLQSHPDFSISFHTVDVRYQDKSKPNKQFPSPEMRKHKKVLNLSDLLESNFIQTNSAVYRWRFIDEDLRATYPIGVVPGDWIMHILHAEIGKIGFMDRCMTVYRRHDKGLWWSRGKIDFWNKYADGHMKSYQYVLNRYGDDPVNRTAILRQVQTVFYEIANLASDDKLLLDLIKNYPLLAVGFVRFRQESRNNALKVLKDQQQLNDLTNAHVKKLETLTHKQQADLEKLNAEMEAITESLGWRLMVKFKDLSTRSTK
jgi:glycosyltransferase involved in cell wall biosynthesis